MELVYKKILQKAYSISWPFFALAFLALYFLLKGLEVISSLIGFSYSLAALFLTLLISMFLILIQFSIVFSKLSVNNKRLVRDFDLLKSEIMCLHKPTKPTNYM